jgi:hypothetical protein
MLIKMLENKQLAALIRGFVYKETSDPLYKTMQFQAMVDFMLFTSNKAQFGGTNAR